MEGMDSTKGMDMVEEVTILTVTSTIFTDLNFFIEERDGGLKGNE